MDAAVIVSAAVVAFIVVKFMAQDTVYERSANKGAGHDIHLDSHNTAGKKTHDDEMKYKPDASAAVVPDGVE